MRLAADTRGSVAIIFAVTLSALMVAAGVAVDFAFMSVRKTHLQGAADAAALAGARQLQLADADPATVQTVANNVVFSNFSGNSDAVSIVTKVSSNPASVTVELTQSPGLFLVGSLLGIDDTDITVNATAQLAGNLAICILALEPIENAIWLQNSASITGEECGVYSNSTSYEGIATKGTRSNLHSKITCSAGGYDGYDSTYTPIPTTDCPAVKDPLAGREPPPVGSCTATDLEFFNSNVTLSPGVYCGGLSITGNSNITLKPGTYVIKDGPLLVDGHSSFVGDGVGFYLFGDLSTFQFGFHTTVALTAPSDGPMAGLLFFEDHNAPLNRPHKIKSSDAKLLLGTFYVSRGTLMIDAKAKIAQDSAYTVVIARRLKLFNGPNLVLNTDYGNSDVPIPSGLKGTLGEKVHLSD